MNRRAVTAVLLLIVSHFPAFSEEQPWPGLRLRDALEAARTIREARVLSREDDQHQLHAVFLKSDRDLALKYLRGDETMWFALVLRGEEIDPRQWWISYRGELVNLALLFSYGEELPPAPVPRFRWTDPPSP